MCLRIVAYNDQYKVSNVRLFITAPNNKETKRNWIFLYELLLFTQNRQIYVWCVQWQHITLKHRRENDLFSDKRIESYSLYYVANRMRHVWLLPPEIFNNVCSSKTKIILYYPMKWKNLKSGVGYWYGCGCRYGSRQFRVYHPHWYPWPYTLLYLKKTSFFDYF